MNRSVNFALSLSAALLVTQVLATTTIAAPITFYEAEGFRGRVFSADRPINNLERYGFNDRASSVIVDRGRWEVCEDANFGGHCVVLRPGSYDSLNRMGINNRISSVRQTSQHRSYDNELQQPLAAPNYEYRRRPNEHMYEAPITSVHAVVGQAEQRCWVEREQVNDSGRRPNVGGAIAGAIIGGVLGHQIGGGRGKDIATAGGAVVGGAIGANAGHHDGGGYDRDVRRCETVASATPEYWDVTYNYRGVEHRVQLGSAPGNTIAVNRNGEPRG